MITLNQTATRAVHLAKFLHAYGCEVIDFNVSETTVSCYIVAAIHRKTFRVRVSDHNANPRSFNRKSPTYLVRLDKDQAGTPLSLSRWISNKVLGRGGHK